MDGYYRVKSNGVCSAYYFSNIFMVSITRMILDIRAGVQYNHHGGR